MQERPFQFSSEFAVDRCDFCGDCLEKCPVMELPIERAKQEMHALVDGDASEVLTRCTGCMACNTLCPTDANPHALILSRWQERYLHEGIPARGALVLPYQKGNLIQRGLGRLPEDERALVEQWERNWRNPPKDCDTMVYAGCNLLLQPFLAQSRLFDGLTIFGAPELCCGEPLYRMGCRDEVRTVAKRLKREFEKMGLRRILLPCLAGYHLFKHVYPEVLGVPFDFEIVSMVDWMLERIDDGRLPVQPVNKTAVIHDSCWPKASGPHFFDRNRELLARCGVEVLEPEHTRAEALCCGMCACAARFSLLDALKTAHQRIHEFEATGADLSVNYCGGCNWLFHVAARFRAKKLKQPAYHLFEVVQMALGETPPHRTRRRAGQVAASLTLPLMAGYVNPGRFWIDDIEGDLVERESD